MPNNENLKNEIVKEITRTEKENFPYEIYGKESRKYWYNLGKISALKNILKKL